MLYAFLVATILIALAELGDKTQLLALVLATRFKVWQVLIGIFVATLAIHLLSVAVGATVGRFIPQTVLSWGSALLFVGFGIWTLRGEDEHEEDEAGSRASDFGPILTVAVAFFVAELGDKTQIMTMAIAADPAAALRTFGGFARSLVPTGFAAPTGAAAFLGVWLGSVAGMMLADGIAILVGAVLGRKLPEQLITRISGVAFILFGVAMVVGPYLVR